MSFPAPDIGVARFPGPDTGMETFPRQDVGRATFPPAPTPVIFINAETVIDILSEGVAIGVPWNVFETVVDIALAATVTTSAEILTSTTVDIVSSVQRIFDVVTSETIVDITSAATVAPSPNVISGTSVDITSAAIVGAPAAIAIAETTVDITSDVISIPVTSFIGTTTVDIASTAAAIPVVVINSSTSVDIASTATITNFGLQSMTKNGDQNIDRYVWTQIGPWSAGTGATVVGNSLRVTGSGNATIEVGSEWSVAADAKDWRVLRNGVVVWTKGSASGNPFAHTFPLSVSDGDLLTVEGYAAAGTASRRTIIAGANTYLRVVPV